MSHFTVLVIGDNPEEQLAAFHEFECTGEDNEYVQDIDITEKALKEYDEETEAKYKDTEGNLHSPYEDKFYRDPTPEEIKLVGSMGGSGFAKGISYSSRDWGDGKGYRPKVHFLPEGWEEVRVYTHDVESFAEWVEGYYGVSSVAFGGEIDLAKTHKYGYILLGADGKVLQVIDRTNPNRKWDWYQLGGRWTGFFLLKPTPVAILNGRTGTPGLMTKEAKLGYADQCRIKDIDVEGMYAESVKEAGERYDKIMNVVGTLEGFIPWKDFLKRCDAKEITIDEARKQYHNQVAKQALKNSPDKDHFWVELDEYLCTREDYVEIARVSSIVTFALIKDGKWYERGEMGWWGVVSNEKDRDAWDEQFYKFFNELSEDTLVSVYDCHI
jgi:hypothetical protein